MHSLLENYLSEVTAHLSPLPVKRRAEELREMRTHLENAVIVNRELGQPEGEAVQAAVAQFGTPADLGENVVWVWRRERTLNGRDFWGAALSTPLMLLFLWLAISHIPPFAIPWLDRYCAEHKNFAQTLGVALSDGMFFATFGLVGIIAGRLFPKRAMRGVGLGLAFFWIGWANMNIFHSGWFHMNLRILSLNATDIGWILTALLAAWTGSRWRQARRGRVWMVRG